MMRHSSPWRRRVAAALLTSLTIGCGGSSTSTERTPSALLAKSDKPEIDSSDSDRKSTEAKRVDQPTESPADDAAFDLPAGWIQSAPRPLPDEDQGYSVGYNHETGVAVTFYQYSRGLVSISDDLNAPDVANELLLAKAGIDHLVKSGSWQAAEEIATGTTSLGDSQIRARWSRYRLTVDDGKVLSDIYIWVSNNRFVKIRCTSNSDDAIAFESTLDPLLTFLASHDEMATR